MTNYRNDVLDEMMSDRKVGAGNFFRKVLECTQDHDRTIIVLDEPIKLPTGEEKISLTLKDVELWSNSTAAWYEQHHITVKDPVGLYIKDSVESFIHYLALTSIGAIPVLINGKISEDIAAKFLIDVGAVMVISSHNKHIGLRLIFKALDYHIEQINLTDMVVSKGSPSRFYQHQPDDPVLLGHTSGTTGIPKAVQFNHYGFFFGVKKQLKKQVGERILSALPHSHAAAISITMSTLLRGALLKVQTHKEATDLFSAIAHFKADMFVSFPKVYVDLCRYDFSQYDLSSISYWLSTGDANHEPHIRKLVEQGSYRYKDKQFKGSIFIDNLGSSEFGFAAFRNIHYPYSNHFSRRIGLPFDWVEAAVLDDNGNNKDVGEVGYLGVKSPSITVGYWNNTLLSEKNRLTGFWLTGDLVYKDKDGVFYHVDRTTDPIHTAQGVLYSCQTEELILKNFPEIFDCSIVGVRNESNYQQPVLSVETISSRGIDELLDLINQLLIDNQRPQISSIIFESANTNLGATGKKLKRVMRNSLEAS